MLLKKSPKIFENYKSEVPETIIQKVVEGFSKYGIKLEYRQTETGENTKIFSGRCFIKNTPFGTNGKGCTPVLAKASAFSEMVERVSSGAILRGFSYLTRRSDCSKLLNFDKDALTYLCNYGFLRGYSYSKPSKYSRSILPERFIPICRSCEEVETEINKEYNHWVDAYSINKKEKVSVPITLVQNVAGSNGLAAGGTMEEAIVQATCEIMERYCFRTVLENALVVPTISRSTIRNQKIQEILDYYKKLNVDIEIKDFTLGNRFPVMGAVFINRNLENEKNKLKKDKFYIRMNAGAALDLDEAILRCLTENMQGYSRSDILTHPTMDVVWDHWVLRMKKPYYGFLSQYDSFRHRSAKKYFDIVDGKPPVVSHDMLSFRKNNDFLDDLNDLIRICDNENLELLYIDSSNKELGLSSVRVVIPELCWMIPVNKMGPSMFYKYIIDDDWWDEKDEIISFIAEAEKYLASSLYGYRVGTALGESKTLFEILAIANLRVKNFREALGYFELVRDIVLTSRFDKIIDCLNNKDYGRINEEYHLKNPFVFGIDNIKNLTQGLMLGLELDKLSSIYG